MDRLPAHTFAIERRAGLQRMGCVIPDVDVLAEKLRTYTITEKRPLVEQRQAAEIPEHEADDVEHCGGLKDDGVFSGGEIEWVDGLGGFSGGGFRQGLGIEASDVG